MTTDGGSSYARATSATTSRNRRIIIRSLERELLFCAGRLRSGAGRCAARLHAGAHAHRELLRLVIGHDVLHRQPTAVHPLDLGADTAPLLTTRLELVRLVPDDQVDFLRPETALA